MTESELTELFAGTTGNITIREESGGASVTSRDFAALALIIEIFNQPEIDLVTETGDAVRLVVRQPLAAHQRPLPTAWGDCGHVFSEKEFRLWVSHAEFTGLRAGNSTVWVTSGIA